MRPPPFTISPTPSIPAESTPDPLPPRPFTFLAAPNPLLKASPDRLTTALTAHADQKPRERLLLYSLIFALAPLRCLEIGVRWGGGSRIIHAALSDLRQGLLISLDPAPDLEFNWSEISDRATLLTAPSPQALPQAALLANGLFDFVFIDGDHSKRGVLADLAGIIPFTQPHATILLHDAFHTPVAQAIDEAVLSGSYTDCGLLANTPNRGVRAETNEPLSYGGVRLLRRTSSP